MTDEFIECPTCASKPGSPVLCPSCLHNRDTINRLNGMFDRLETDLRIAHNSLRFERKYSKKLLSDIAEVLIGD